MPATEPRLNLKRRQLLHIAAVKEKLAEKYARLAKTVSSKVRRRLYLNRVKKYTLQAKNARTLASRFQTV